jgi:hypothetical protein
VPELSGGVTPFPTVSYNRAAERIARFARLLDPRRVESRGENEKDEEWRIENGERTIDVKSE